MKRPPKKTKKGGRPTSKGAMQAQRRTQLQQQVTGSWHTEEPIFQPDYFAYQALLDEANKFRPLRNAAYENSDLFDRCPLITVKVRRVAGIVDYDVVHPVVLLDHVTALYVGLLRNIMHFRSVPANGQDQGTELSELTDLKKGCDSNNITLDDLQDEWREQYDRFVSLCARITYGAFPNNENVQMPFSLTKKELRGGAYRGYLRALQPDFKVQDEVSWLLEPQHTSALNYASVMSFRFKDGWIVILSEKMQKTLEIVFQALVTAEAEGNTQPLLSITAPDFDPNNFAVDGKSTFVLMKS